ncbi:Beta-lactamase OXY-2 [Pararobbsia alpina]|uniref:class A beta-lactamase n=1 Tax=Pararobbsia alpina TaxID=621374 RepID=UPI0039A6FB63
MTRIVSQRPVSPTRRSLLVTAILAPLLRYVPARAANPDATLATIHDALAALERTSGGRLGVAVTDTATNARAGYRSDERFAFCSTFKVVLSSAVLKRNETEPGLLDRHIDYTKAEMVSYSPITEKHLGEGMTVAALCAAALQYSDNSAANALLRLIGGPEAVTAFAHSVGDTTFRLDRTETTLNTAIPGDPRDTSTPAAMAALLQKFALGDVLAPDSRRQLVEWMRGNTTGGKRIRAGVPSTWEVADKTGTGDYGTTNDLGLAWPPERPPLVIATYYTQPEKGTDAPARDDVLASAARIVSHAFG